MPEIGLWVKILKALKICEKTQIEVYQKTMQVYENSLHKIVQMKSFLENPDISDYEIEVYSRSLSSLSMKLVKTWEKLVKISISTLADRLNKIIDYNIDCTKTVKSILNCCTDIKGECFEEGSVKEIYKRENIEESIFTIGILEEVARQKYLKDF